MSLSDRAQAEIEQTLGVLAPIVRDLRRRGYDATAWVEHRDDHYTVEVRVRIPPLGTPVEAAARQPSNYALARWEPSEAVE